MKCLSTVLGGKLSKLCHQKTLFLLIETMKLISISDIKKSFEIIISKFYRGARPQHPSNADSVVLGPLPHPPKKGSKENFRLGAY